MERRSFLRNITLSLVAIAVPGEVIRQSMIAEDNIDLITGKEYFYKNIALQRLVPTMPDQYGRKIMMLTDRKGMELFHDAMKEYVKNHY